MAKEFYTNGTGSSQILNPSDESKIKIYDSKADADLDLANIEENEIIATKAGESEGVVEVVDTVEEDNPNAVSSGAVSEVLANSHFIIDSYQRPIGSDGVCWTVNKRNLGYALIGWYITTAWTGGQLRTQKVFANTNNAVTEGILFTSTGTLPNNVRMTCIYMKVE